MRIIAGTHRALPLKPPPGDSTRPITDRAKQSLFDALQDCFAGGVVLDCFAGTGSMGLECLSRGAARAIFIERGKAVVLALKENIAALQAEDRARILTLDAYTLTPATFGDDRLTIAFVDPPYAHAETGHTRHKLDELIRMLAAHCMVDGGIISLRHPARVTVDPAALGVSLVRELRYGDMAITWLRKAEPVMADAAILNPKR